MLQATSAAGDDKQTTAPSDGHLERLGDVRRTFFFLLYFFFLK
jgi:hypothetical protein